MFRSQIDSRLRIVSCDGTRRDYKLRHRKDFAVTYDSDFAYPWQPVELDDRGRAKSSVNVYCFKTSREAVNAIENNTWSRTCE